MAKLKVRAVAGGDIKWAGYYDLQRRKPGEEFFINAEKDFSGLWMEAVGWTPAPLTENEKLAKKEIIRQSSTTPLDIKKELENRAKTNKTPKAVVVPEVVEEVNVEDKSPNPREEVI